MAKSPISQTQHRPSRDTAHAKELADSRREVNKLTREVARLRRQLEKKGPETIEEPTVTLAGPAMDPNSGETFVKPQSKGACPACGSKDIPDLIETPGGKSILVCTACKARQIQR